jgi:hypothetical protein
MKTTLGIFGDSFASQQLPMHNNYPSWVDILSNSYQVTCHSIVYENSLYESKMLFDQFYTNYDKIVFVITDPYRFQLQLTSGYYYTVSNVDDCSVLQERLNISKFTEDWYKLEYAKQWTMLDPHPLGKYKNYVQLCTIEDILDLRSDTVLIPAFNNSIPQQSACLNDIRSKELEQLTLPKDFFKQYIDLRPCHMTAFNNNVFAQQVDRILQGTNNSINLSDYEAIPADQFDIYFKKR